MMSNDQHMDMAGSRTTPKDWLSDATPCVSIDGVSQTSNRTNSPPWWGRADFVLPSVVGAGLIALRLGRSDCESSPPAVFKAAAVLLIALYLSSSSRQPGLSVGDLR